MTQNRLAAWAIVSCLATGTAWAQAPATPSQTTAPGLAASPSAEANRDEPAQNNSAPVRAGAPTGPGKAAAPSVAANRGHHRRSHNRAPASGAASTAQGAGGAASVAQSPSSSNASPK